MIDMDALMKGEDYENLKESYVLFICKYDPFKDKNEKPFGLPRYTFRNFCEENNLVNLDDKSLKIFYNSTAYEDEKDERIKALLRFVQTNEPQKDDFSNRLNALVAKLKKNEIFKQEYSRMNLHDRDIRKEGMKLGAQQKAIENAVMIVQKYKASPEDAARDAGAPFDKVLEALAAQPAPAQA